MSDPDSATATTAPRRAAISPPPASPIARELSQLALIERVLAMAGSARVPLAERLRYAAITASVLDEFFEVRITDLVHARRARRASAEQAAIYAAVVERAHAITRALYHELYTQLLPRLAAHGVAVLAPPDWSAEQARWLRRFFLREVRPALAPIGLSPSHPFPHVLSRALNFIVRYVGATDYGRGRGVAILRVPRGLARVIELPAQLTPGAQGFVLLADLIEAHLAELFVGAGRIEAAQFRLTRDSELALDEDEAPSLRDAMRSELARRAFGIPVRLEIGDACPAPLGKLLTRQFSLGSEAVFRVPGAVNLTRLAQIAEAVRDPALLWPRFAPRSSQLAAGTSIFASLQCGDVLLHHPYESFGVVLDFLLQAARDPQVVSIRMTLYRTAASAEIAAALEEAAQRGKDVTVVVELKARFDEEANLDLADRLERAGVQVVHGVCGVKTHVKMILITRRERGRGPARLARYVHLSTGNYHAGTARLYTDFAMLSAEREIAGDVEQLFLHLTGLTAPQRLKRLWWSPFDLRQRLLAAIAREAAQARRGAPARIVARMNALAEPGLIEALYAAGRAGVSIDLIVRGVCTLRPGVAGLSDNIRVHSVIGRFLEHSRVFWFHDAGRDRVYLSSADGLARNLFRRVEVAWPVRDAALKRRVIEEGLLALLVPAPGAWRLDAAGHYHPAHFAAGTAGAQDALIERLAAAPLTKPVVAPAAVPAPR